MQMSFKISQDSLAITVSCLPVVPAGFCHVASSFHFTEVIAFPEMNVPYSRDKIHGENVKIDRDILSCVVIFILTDNYKIIII